MSIFTFWRTGFFPINMSDRFWQNFQYFSQKLGKINTENWNCYETPTSLICAFANTDISGSTKRVARFLRIIQVLSSASRQDACHVTHFIHRFLVEIYSFLNLFMTFLFLFYIIVLLYLSYFIF